MWLLLLIKLVLTPTPHVVEVEIVDFFDSEQKCIQKIKTIPNTEMPLNVNMGCVPLNGKNVSRDRINNS
jgi:hypothetical protein